LLAVVFRPALAWVAGGVGAGLLLPFGAIGLLLGFGWVWGLEGVAVGRRKRCWARCWGLVFGVLVGVPLGVIPRSDHFVRSLISLPDLSSRSGPEACQDMSV
jgi:hypothetical protein